MASKRAGIALRRLEEHRKGNFPAVGIPDGS
jgi:hypothetical protein